MIRVIFLVIITTFIFTSCLVADMSIGISPSKIITKIKKGEKIEKIIKVSRSDRVGDIKFNVNVSKGTSLIDLQGQDSVIIPAGQQTVDFKFVIDATQVEAGEYNNIIYFSLDAPPAQDQSQTDFKYTLGLKTDIKVTPSNFWTNVKLKAKDIINYFRQFFVNMTSIF